MRTHESQDLDAYVRDSPAPQGDELIYHLIDRDPFDPHTFPFAYRFGVPLLVHVLRSARSTRSAG